MSISADVFSQSVVNSSKNGNPGDVELAKTPEGWPQKTHEPDPPDPPDPVVKPGRPNHTNRACFPDDVSIHKANSLKIMYD